MNRQIEQLLLKSDHSHQELIYLLSAAPGNETNLILEKGLDVKASHAGRNVYLRGLIELSNRCAKNCHYCGIRGGNRKVERYTLSEVEVLNAARFAWNEGFGSLVIQTGERKSKQFTTHIEHILKAIHKATNHELTITLSCGEQTKDTYNRWRDAGADRYLLRIETTNQELFQRIHPNNDNHSFAKRLDALNLLRKTGFQVGTGVMIGLPGQTLADLADDLLFFKSQDIDMVGMGPYIEHADTPMYPLRSQLWPATERFRLGLLMIALLRINMPWINIAASTALETLDPLGRQKGILAGANVVMPNLTPVTDRKKYQLYDNKPNLDKDASLSAVSLKAAVSTIGETICLHKSGDSLHFLRRTFDV